MEKFVVDCSDLEFLSYFALKKVISKQKQIDDKINKHMRN